ncbi:sugar phosphate isomerase/epimerase family protein [Brachybacterium phenoliresistens]|uniref:Xylose isomerase n=1 Tax=Brachybacterium phenoliresistens TaxID=396014 RepID=Z9JX38_9MICO|nr:sugar phosphate isomerase/epimerase [Brachybacterium phenoliresistens]EWS82764.1 xylose isomerase [Brachybacterium phenoliresistens]
MLISVQLYSVREALAADPIATLSSLRDMGFESVEPFGILDWADTLRTALPELGLSAPSTHAGVLAEADPARLFGVAANLGVRTVIEPHRDRSHWTSVDDIRRTADLLNGLAGTAAEEGVRLGYHNHEFELETDFEGRTGLEVLSEDLDPRVVLEVDTFWAAVGGQDPAQLLRRLGQQVQLAHLKDGPLNRETSQQKPIGQGEMDVPAILEAAPWLEIGVIEFDDYAGDVLEGIRQSREALGRLQSNGE